MQNKDSGLYRGKRHKDGGIPVIVDGNTPVEVEGGEYKICRDAYYSNDILSFKNKTNKEILDYIHNDFGCKFEQNKAQSGDFILCRLVVGNDERKDRQGTVEQILNEMQDEVGCKIENADTIKKDGGEVNEESQLYIDIISMNPSSERNNKYKDILKNKYGIIYDDIDKDDYYIENANLSEIKSKKDFLNFDKYIKYAKAIFKLRGLINIQPKHIEGVITIEEAKKLGEKLGFKIKHKEYNGGGNYAAHDLTDTIIMPYKVDVNTFIHELGHHYDHFESKDYEGFAKTITYASSPYHIDKSNEVFAENFMHYFIAPNWLKKNLPIVYDELDKNIKLIYRQEVNKIINNKLEEGGEVSNQYQLTKYILSAETENDSKELYSGYDYNRAKSEFDSVDINDYDGEHGFFAVLGKVVYDYQFVGSLDEDESIDDYPFTVFYDDEDYYKLQSQSDFEEIDTKVVENVNKASDSLLNDVENYYASKYNKGYSAKYINIQVTNGLDYYDENHIEYGCVQLRFADHSWNAANNDRFGNCDYYISIVIANKNKTKERFGVSMFELKNNEVELTFNSDDDFDSILSEIDRQIEEAKEYVIEKHSGNNPDIKYGHGGGIKTDFNDYENDDFSKAMLSLWNDFTNGRISNYLNIENENYVLNDQDGLMVIFRNKDLGDFTKVEREYIVNWFNTYLDANKKPFISKYIDTFYVEANRIIIKLKPQIMYAKGGTLLLAPNGNPSNLTPEQYKLVRTPEFKAWFGDWENDPENASKVIDENGEPLVVYRGFNKKSDAGFVFKYKVNRFKHNRKANRFAHYFTRSKNVALEYAEQGEKIDDEDVIVKSYFLKCDKMLNLTKENPLYPTYEEWIKTRHNVFLYSPHDIVEKLKKRSIPIHSYLFDSVLSKAKNENDINELSELKINELVKQIKKEEKEELKRYESSEDVNFFHLFKLITGKEASQNIANDIDEYKAEARRDVYNYFINYKPSDSIIMPDLDLFLKDLIIENNFNGGKFNEWQFGVKKQTDKEVYFVFESNQIKLADGTNTTFDSDNPDIRFEKGGRTIAQTPAPKKDRVYGSDVNKPESAKDIESAESISFDDKTLHTISNKIETHNKKYPNKHIDLATAKAVVRRGMGAYSKSHRPTISGGMPNDRTAWGLARLNAFLYKAVHGESKSGKYSQDNDLLDELNIKHKKFASGGTVLLAPNGNPSNLTAEQWHLVRTPEFKQWFGDWKKLAMAKLKDPAIDEITLKNLSENVSKVVDENGEPLVVYHGTFREFSVFEISKDGGFYFTEFKRIAEIYATSVQEGKTTKKPNENPIVLPCFLNLRNILTENVYGIVGKNVARINKAKNKRYDGLIIKGGRDIGGYYDQIIAFYPEQIKLADGTNTTFDGNNPDIRFKKGGEMTSKEIAKEIISMENEADKLIDYYESGGKIEDSCLILDKNGERAIDKESIDKLTECVERLPQTKTLNYDFNKKDYYPERKELHKEIIKEFKEKVYCINDDKQPIAILMGGSPASGKSTFIKKFAPFILSKDILKVDADEIRAKLPEYKGFNATQTHLETKDIVSLLLSDKNIGIPCRFDLVYDGTMNSIASYEPLIHLLKSLGYKTYIIYIDNVPYDVIVERALNRYRKSGRFVPIKVIDDFFSKKNEAIEKLKKEVDGYVIIDGGSPDYKIIETKGDNIPKIRNYEQIGRPIDLTTSEILREFARGGTIETKDKKQTYEKWRKLVNMSASELKRFYDSDEGKVAGLTKEQAEEQGIHSGRESARWIIKMKHTPYTQWTPTMWEWANRQISFVSRMSGMKGDLYKDGKPTRKLLALKIWGNDPEKYELGGQIGDKGYLRFTSNVEVPYTYKLIEAKDLIPSHLPSGERNPLHTIAEAQPKERNDLASKMAQDEIASSPRFKELSESTNAYFGTPVVNKQGEVIQGNNRSIGLKKHYVNGGTSYKKDLINNAERFGFTKEEVENIDEPILVREVPANHEFSIELGNYTVNDLETGGKQRIDPLIISRKISANDKVKLSSIVFDDNYKTTNEAIRANIGEVGGIIKQYINSAQYASLFSKNGELQPKGIEDIEGVINYFLFEGGDVLLPEIFTDLNNTVQKGLQKSLKYIYKPDERKSILPEIQIALKILYEFGNSGIEDFKEWESQLDMFTMKSPSERFDKESLKLAYLFNKAKKQTDIVNYIREYANLVSDKPADMFEPEIKGLSKEKAFSMIFGTEMKPESGIQIEQPKMELITPTKVHDLSKFKNPYQINRAIEQLIREKGKNREDYSPEDIEFISYYSGYGGLEKQGSFTNEELKGLLYEFFTPDEVVKKMWGLAYKYGYGTLQNQSVLEPSVGVGAFLKYAPDNVPVVGNEINEYSAAIAQILYPHANIKLQYFEQNFIKNNTSVKGKIDKIDKFGLVIGNPPYGKLGGIYQGMGEKDYTNAANFAEYFIIRGLDMLYSGGLLIYIVGAEQKNGGTLFLDSEMNKGKQSIFDKAELLDAYRLPIKIFERTGVSSEIVVFKKR